MIEYEIDKNISIPETQEEEIKKGKLFPLDIMEKGDSFVFDGEVYDRLRHTINVYRNINDKKFYIVMEDGSSQKYRCFRIK